MQDINVNQINWEKCKGLVPAVIQNVHNGQVLMLGYMNQAALAHTIDSKKVTFFSRSKNRLWTKGETSGNWLDYVSSEIDCDADTILIHARPNGPVCHTGTLNCFNDVVPDRVKFLVFLQNLISERRAAMPVGSYTTSLFADGKARIAQKVGEEGVELALAHMKGDKDEIANEAADLLFHILILLEDANITLNDVIQVLELRQNKLDE